MKKRIPQNILINRCLKGDTKAEFELFCKYAKAMTNVAFRITGNSFDAEDVTQDAFIIAFKKLGTFNNKSTFGVWLKRIVVNESLQFMRKQKVSFSNINDEQIIEVDSVEVADTIEMEKLMLAVNELPDGARSVFCLKAIENYKMTEIADIIGISVSNVKVQYHRAKQLLKVKLEHKLFVD